MRKLLFLFQLCFVLLSYAQEQPPSNLEGQQLREWLKSNWYTGKFNSQGYNGARTAMYSFIDKRADGKVYCVYTGFNQESRETSFLDPINAEHSVPQSWFDEDEPMKSDIMHLFPTHGSVNSARSNKPYNEIPDNTVDKWYTGNASGISTPTTIPTTSIELYSENRSDSFEPREDHKGDLARVIFYFFTVYDISSHNGKTINNAILSGELDQLYEWHLNDPVDDWEAQRNQRISTIQGNRNPYVDYPNLVCRAWGLSCSDGGSPVVSFTQSLQPFPATSFGEASTAQSYQVQAGELEDDLSIVSSAHFQVSIDNLNFSNQLALTPTQGTVNSTTIYVRFAPVENTNGVLNGTLTHSSTRLDNATINLSGTVNKVEYAEPNLSFEISRDSIDSFDSYNLIIESDIPLEQPLALKLALSNARNISYGSNGFVTSPTMDNGILTLNMPIASREGTVQFTFNDRMDIDQTFEMAFTLLGGSGFSLGEKKTFSLTYAEKVTPLQRQEIQYSFYPNPTKDRLYIIGKLDPDQIALHDLFGKRLNIRYEPNNQSLVLPELTDGVYFISVRAEGGVLNYKLIVKN